MADKKISALSAATALAGIEVMPVVQGGSTVKATTDQIGALTAPPYAVGRYYMGTTPLLSASPVAPGAGSLRAYPVFIRRRVTIVEIALRVSTAAAGNVQVAVYAAHATSQMPTGSPVYSSPSLSTAATGAISATGLTLTLAPGIYWIVTNCDNATAIFTSKSTSSTDLVEFVGATVSTDIINAAAALTGYSKTQTFGTWPTLTGSFATDGWALLTSASVPVAAFKP